MIGSRLRERLKPYFRRTPKAPAQAGAVAAPAPASPSVAAGSSAIPLSQPDAVAGGELASRHEQLARRLAELQWDLGGLAYEMAIRDHFRLDLLVRKAAEQRTVDAELAAVERSLELAQTGAAGSCPSCGALYSRGAVFCWQCGSTVTRAPAPPSAPPAPRPDPRARSAAGGGVARLENGADPAQAAQAPAAGPSSPAEPRATTPPGGGQPA